MKPTLVSVVIATYRRTEMLRDTVVSLTQLEVPQGVSIEVVVIDNDPAGGARPIAGELVTRCAGFFDVRYVHEQRKGLSFARNRGIEEARGDIIAFLDDDMFIGSGWLKSILDCFQRTGAAVVGGRTLIHWEGEPEAVIRRCERDIVALDMGDRDFEVRGKRLPGGGNAAFLRSVFAGGLRFSTELGRVGTVLLSGEDSELFARVRKAGGAIWYCAGGVVRHRTGGERLTIGYVLRQSYWFGISHAIIDRRLHGKGYQIMQALARAGKAVVLDAPSWLLAWVRRDAARKLLARRSLVKQLGYLRATLSAVLVPATNGATEAAPQTESALPQSPRSEQAPLLPDGAFSAIGTPVHRGQQP